MAKSHDELEADFRQYYGLDLNDAGKSYTVSHAAVLAAQLPNDSRCKVKANPDLSWSMETWMLWRIDFQLASIAYSMGGKGARKPKPLDTPSQTKRIQDALDRTDYKAIADRLGVEYGDRAS